MRRIAILRCGKLPSFVNWEIPNLEELFEEDRLLIRGFKAHGFEARSIVWNQPAIDWDQFDVALIRSTWDYLDEKENFLQVLADVEESSCRLFNPIAAVRWNIDKHYLLDLEAWGVPIIPTYLASHIDRDALHKRFAERQVQSVILKPAIGLGGSHSYRLPLDEFPSTLEDLRTKQPHREYLIQPFFESVITEGEWSFVYFNRECSHVLLKKPAPHDYRVQGIYGGTVQPAEPSSRDLLQAEAVIAKLPFDVLYARLDFIRVDNRLSVIEVELIEPILEFGLVPESIGRFVNAVKIKLEKTE